MLFFFSKLLALPMYPLGLAIVLLGVSALLFTFKKSRIALVSGAAAMVVLIGFSFPPVSWALTRSLERHYAQKTNYQTAEAIVLLSGHEVPGVPPRLHDETNWAGDRLLYTARLFKNGVSPRIVVTGGFISLYDNYRRPASVASFNMLTQLFAIDSSRIFLETNSRNTYENGIFVSDLFAQNGWKKNIILVTSASHMRRSVAIFEKLGFTVQAAPADFFCDMKFNAKLLRFFPTVTALFESTVALHEYYGILAYRILGRM